MRFYTWLINELKARYKGGLYHLTQIELAYNSNRIEGSTLNEDQTFFLFETDSIKTEGEDFVNKNDVIEMSNHFILFNYMLENADSELSEPMIKEFHRILKQGVVIFDGYMKPVGEYKQLPNSIGGKIATAEPHAVPKEIRELLLGYNEIRTKNLSDILDFHYKFEKIHPFFDGNGRVGRMIMFKECLRHDIVPFIIKDKSKDRYYSGLKNYADDGDALKQYILSEQAEYAKLIEKFTSIEI